MALFLVDTPTQMYFSQLGDSSSCLYWMLLQDLL